MKRYVRSDNTSNKFAEIEKENYGVRRDVADNPNTPPDVLARLADDRDEKVRKLVAENPNTPPEVSARLAESKNTSSHTNSKNNRWSSIIKGVQNDIESGFDDPLYELTEAGEAITNICYEVEEKLNLYLEPSVQAGSGGIWIYDEDGTTLAEGIDYAGFNKDVIDMAIESRSKKEFVAKYKEYLEHITFDY